MLLLLYRRQLAFFKIKICYEVKTKFEDNFIHKCNKLSRYNTTPFGVNGKYYDMIQVVYAKAKNQVAL